MTDEARIVDEIAARHGATTRGPWRWKGNLTSKTIEIMARGSRVVMDLRRWGTQGAQPCFVTDGIIRKPVLIPSAPHNDWDIVAIDHPDARFLVGAWADVAALLPLAREALARRAVPLAAGREVLDRLRALLDGNVAAQSAWSLTDDGPVTDIRNAFEPLLRGVDRRDAEMIVAAINGLPGLLALAEEALGRRAAVDGASDDAAVLAGRAEREARLQAIAREMVEADRTNNQPWLGALRAEQHRIWGQQQDDLAWCQRLAGRERTVAEAAKLAWEMTGVVNGYRAICAEHPDEPTPAALEDWAHHLDAAAIPLQDALDAAGVSWRGDWPTPVAAGAAERAEEYRDKRPEAPE